DSIEAFRGCVQLALAIFDVIYFNVFYIFDFHCPSALPATFFRYLRIWLNRTGSYSIRIKRL
ncbi:MAG: hypothetical protein LUE92_05385, partial [Clostridiales bacterium]|nr:hypothetical protein [Clostridiales bacterium]